MSASDWLAGVAGGLSGINAERIRRDNRAFDERKLAEQGEVQRLREEIRLMVAEMNEGGRADRHATPSGSVVEQQTGATARNAATNQTRERGQDLTYNLGVRRNETTRRGQDIDHEEFGRMNDRLWNQALMGNDRAHERNWLTERGQDIGYEVGLRRTGRARTTGKDAASGQSWLTIDDMDRGVAEPDPLLPAPYARDVTLAAPLPPSVMRRPAQTPAARPTPPGAREYFTLPSGQRVTAGQTVTLRSGQRVTIKKINPDGTFVY